MKRVLLVNMPFADVEIPSIALGLFKAQFDQEGIPCNVLYLNILFAEMIGLENYSVITGVTSPYAGEQMFARSLFGSSVPLDDQYYNDVIYPMSPKLVKRLRLIKSYVGPFLKMSLERIRWQDYHIIGFTTMFEQNLPSLSLAYRVKCRFPGKIIVFGGANCEGIMGKTLHHCFPFIDVVFSGEADKTFPEFVRRCSENLSIHDLPGLIYRQGRESIYTGKGGSIRDLDSLPFPNYDEYYHRLRFSSLTHMLKPYLLTETSRGCWWGERNKCTFCGLNGENIKYRCKTASRALEEIKHLVDRYAKFRTYFLRLVDNVFNHRYFDDLIPELARLKLPIQIILEVRPTLKKKEIRALAEAGVKYIQPGLEHLSSNTLQKMRKGSTTLQNIQILKWAKQYDVEADWNIILGTPGEGPDDYAKCREMANIITHLKAPSGFGPFRLDRFSCNFENAPEYGLVNVRPHYIYRYLYPFDDPILFDLVYHFDYDNERSGMDQKEYDQLAAQVSKWQQRQDKLYVERNDGLSSVVDSRPVTLFQRYDLNGLDRQVYEYCDKIRTVENISNWLMKRGMSTNRADIEGCLKKFIKQKLMVKEKSRYLSLAVMTYTLDHERIADTT